jgi:hypothetical protein
MTSHNTLEVCWLLTWATTHHVAPLKAEGGDESTPVAGIPPTPSGDGDDMIPSSMVNGDVTVEGDGEVPSPAAGELATNDDMIPSTMINGDITVAGAGAGAGAGGAVTGAKAVVDEQDDGSATDASDDLLGSVRPPPPPLSLSLSSSPCRRPHPYCCPAYSFDLFALVLCYSHDP